MPDATELTAAFDLGAPVAPAEWVASGWGDQNHVWRLTTSRGSWAIKQVGRDLSLDPDDTLALELAAYTGGVPMPRPIPTTRGTCFTVLDGRRYRCHEWVDGVALPWHGHAPSTAAAVGGVLAKLHRLQLPLSSHLAPDRPSPGISRWLAFTESANSFDPALCAALERALPSIQDLEALTSTISPVEGMVGSHRDLHPTNVMRLHDGRGFVLVDWDAAGPVVPVQEVACFAVVFGERGNNSGYDRQVARGFIQGYRDAGGNFTFSGGEDLAMLVQGRLWWTEQNLRLAVAPRATAVQRHRPNFCGIWSGCRPSFPKSAISCSRVRNLALNPDLSPMRDTDRNVKPAVFPLVTPRLRLWPLAAEDTDALVCLYSNWQVAKWLSRLPWPFTSASAQAMITEATTDLERGRGYFVRIETRASKAFVGTVSLRLPAYDDEPWTTDTKLGILGYALLAEQHGRGFATEAAASMAQFAFEKLDLHRLRATALRDNIASRRVLERLGFRIRYADVREVPRYGGPPRLGDTYMLERDHWQRAHPNREVPRGPL